MNNKFRVIIVLMWGQYISVYFDSYPDACKYVSDWANHHKQRIASGQIGQVDSTLFCGVDSHGDMTEAVIAQYIIGMYIPNDTQKSPQDRFVDIVEKSMGATREGDEWKGGQ